MDKKKSDARSKWMDKFHPEMKDKDDKGKKCPKCGKPKKGKR